MVGWLGTFPNTGPTGDPRILIGKIQVRSFQTMQPCQTSGYHNTSFFHYFYVTFGWPTFVWITQHTNWVVRWVTQDFSLAAALQYSNKSANNIHVSYKICINSHYTVQQSLAVHPRKYAHSSVVLYFFRLNQTFVLLIWPLPSLMEFFSGADKQKFLKSHVLSFNH